MQTQLCFLYSCTVVQDDMLHLPIKLLSNGELNFFSGVVSPDACCLAIRPCSRGDLKAVAEPPVLAVMLLLAVTEAVIEEAILGGSELGC